MDSPTSTTRSAGEKTGKHAADSAMSSPNMSESQTDNCADSKTISLNQPMTSLPTPSEERQTGAPHPRTEEQISAGPPPRAPAQQEISDVRMLQEGA